MERVREYVEEAKAKGVYVLRVPQTAGDLNVKEPVIAQCFSFLVKEGVIGSRSPAPRWFSGGHSGSYSLTPWLDDLPRPRSILESLPRKRKVSWGSKRRILALIRKKKPWVIEQWYEKDERWFMHMEACDHGLGRRAQHGCTDMTSIAPEDQPDLVRSVLNMWHFDMDSAIKECGRLRRKYPKLTFRTRDTNKGDYVMGDVL
jgi:hypothetical protein